MPGAGKERTEDEHLGADEERVGQLPRLVQSHQSNRDDAYLVAWTHDDKDDPHNWSTPYRSWLTFLLGMLALSASSASAIVAPANPTIARYLGVSQELVTLNISLYV